MLVLGLVAFALLQLWYLHKALIFADPTLVCPSAFCLYNLSSIVNGLVYFDQFALISPLHLGLVILGMFVLLGGVWVVSVQSGGPGSDSGDWSDDESIEGGVSDPENDAHVENVTQERVQDIRHTRSTRSESNPETLSRPPERARSPHSTISQPLPAIILSPDPSLRRRAQHSRAQTSIPNPVTTLGGGFQIGLSPVSPGFSIVPRERGRVVSGINRPYGFGDVVEQGRRERRRRTVSEGDVATRALALEQGDLLSEPLGDEGDEDGARRRARARWRWLSTLVWR